MTFSYKIIKNTQWMESSEGVEIATKIKTGEAGQYALLSAVNECSTGEKLSVEITPEEKELLLQEFNISLEKEREAILAQARDEALLEAEAIRIQARETGYQEGFREGVLKGEKKAHQDMEDLRQQGIQILKDAEKQAEEFLERQNENLIRLAGQMAESIVNHEILTQEETFMEMIREILHEYKKGGMLIISCTRRHVRTLKENVFALKKVNGDIDYMIVENPLLKETQITLEFDHQMIDLDVAGQINAMVLDLLELEV